MPLPPDIKEVLGTEYLEAAPQTLPLMQDPLAHVTDPLVKHLAADRIAQLVGNDIALEAYNFAKNGGRHERKLLTPAEIKAKPAKEWIIQDRLPLAPMLVYTYGLPESGKSLVTLRDLHAISMGLTDSFGFKINNRVRVVYIDTEGSWDFSERMRAVEEDTGVQFDPEWFRAICEQPIAMGNRTDVKYLIQDIESVFPAGPTEPVLTCFDTQAGVTAGINENSSQDMGEVIENYITVARHFYAPTWAIHHSGKSDTDLRGSSAMRGRARVVTHVDGGKVICDKLNGASKYRPFEFGIAERSGGAVAILRDPSMRDPSDIKEKLKAPNAVWEFVLKAHENGQLFIFTEMRAQVRQNVPGVTAVAAERIIKEFLEANVLVIKEGKETGKNEKVYTKKWLLPNNMAYAAWLAGQQTPTQHGPAC